MGCKIAFIGAGSLIFTRKLFTDIMAVPALRTIDVSFTDIHRENLERVTQLCQRDLDANGVNIKIQSTTDRREAFKNANYIVNCVRVGGLEAFEYDIEIPLKYGVDQCIGDTLCAGGVMYAQRMIAATLDFCRDIVEVAAPRAMMLNYANPNAMVTWAANTYGHVNTIGLCHGVIHGEHQIAEVLGIPHEDLDFICAGINHQTWYISVMHHGKSMLHELLPAFEKHEKYAREEKVRIDMLRRFGYYSTESNGHLSEYVAWYRKRPDDLMNWIDLGYWINGETGGHLRQLRESRNWFDKEYPRIFSQPPERYGNKNRTWEHCSYIIEALETRKRYRGHFNVMNEGCITNLPYECAVEVPCVVDGSGIAVPKVGNLPDGCAAICSQSIWVQRLGVEAAVKGDELLLKQAVLMDPLTGAVCNPPEVWQMVDELLVAHEKWLPQYGAAIENAKKRLMRSDIIPTKAYKGAARLPEKSIDEVETEQRSLLAGPNL